MKFWNELLRKIAKDVDIKITGIYAAWGIGLYLLLRGITINLAGVKLPKFFNGFNMFNYNSNNVTIGKEIKEKEEEGKNESKVNFADYQKYQKFQKLQNLENLLTILNIHDAQKLRNFWKHIAYNSFQNSQVFYYYNFLYYRVSNFVDELAISEIVDKYHIDSQDKFERTKGPLIRRVSEQLKNSLQGRVEPEINLDKLSPREELILEIQFRLKEELTSFIYHRNSLQYLSKHREEKK